MASRSEQRGQRKIRKGKRRVSDSKPESNPCVNKATEALNPWRRAVSPKTSDQASDSKMNSPKTSENGSTGGGSKNGSPSSNVKMLVETDDESVQKDVAEVGEKEVAGDDTQSFDQSVGEIARSDEVNGSKSSTGSPSRDSTSSSVSDERDSSPVSDGKKLTSHGGKSVDDDVPEPTGLGYAIKYASNCLQSSNFFASKSVDFDSSTSGGGSVDKENENSIVDSPKNDSKTKIYPLNEDAESDNSDSEPQLTKIEEQGFRNDLGVDHERTPGRKIKIIPPNVEVSPAVSETSLDQAFTEGDSGCLSPGKAAAKRESVSEPLSAPPGFKMIATTMEIGIVRDMVFYAALLHDQLLQADGLLGKSYTICYVTATTGATVVGLVATTTGKIYEVLLPKFVSETGHQVQVKAWNKWIHLDEAVSYKVSDQLTKHPSVRKSCFEILGPVKETKIYQTLEYLNNRVRSLITKATK